MKIFYYAIFNTRISSSLYFNMAFCLKFFRAHHICRRNVAAVLAFTLSAVLLYYQLKFPFTATDSGAEIAHVRHVGDVRNVGQHYSHVREKLQTNPNQNTFLDKTFIPATKVPSFTPINDVLAKQMWDGKNETCNQTCQSIIAQVIRSGSSIQRRVTKEGVEEWMENGVIFRQPVPTKSTDPYPSPYVPELEPFVPFNSSTFFEDQREARAVIGKKKIILWYIPTRYWPKMDSLNPLRFCPDFPCVITTNKTFAEQSAAMVFPGELLRTPPPNRRPEQVFIFSNHEPPNEQWWAQSAIKDKSIGWNTVFNWTMTYRMDSDVTSLYGILRRRFKPITRDYKSILAKKTRKAAVLVSNCKTSGKREKYIAELQKYISVDVYGKCGNFSCPRSDDDKCFQNIDTNYKFYLSFESSICEDYITEKFFRYTSTNTILVVRASNEYSRHAPPEVFINTADYASPKELADKLLYLDQHDSEYISFLQEKDKYVGIYEDYPIREEDGRIRYMHYHYEGVAFCQVCQRLWNLQSYSKTVPDVKEWFTKKMCHPPSDI
ncbi:alpha-(1,3)-fucosyltransferase C-like [Physella acuta]|uniref:alpha-(1,3)-fucosyltransferase C-like n=1 Tax=Physella acuta TaxID=109671 RepID=UPI0027DB9126|nr:alpha-(1,3)-fucosyltransferase C-like [Physella acuta]